jgi:sulfopyruvate decarboxylase subunit alpha
MVTGRSRGDPSECNPSVAYTMLDRLARNGVTHATGVPCSLLKGLFGLLEAGPGQAAGIKYTPVPREDCALGLASGIALGGGFPVVLMQNSGLGYSLNVLTSFNLIYEIPLLLLVSWRGFPGASDAVEHDIIGARLLDLLGVFDIGHEIYMGQDPGGCVDRAVDVLASSGRPTALIIREGV